MNSQLFVTKFTNTLIYGLIVVIVITKKYKDNSLCVNYANKDKSSSKKFKQKIKLQKLERILLTKKCVRVLKTHIKIGHYVPNNLIRL